MNNPFSNCHILIIGFGKSGYSLAKVLIDLNAHVTINELKELTGDEKAEELKNKGVNIISGSHPLYLADKHFDYVVKNPGIPYSNALVAAFIQKNIEIVTEIELGHIIQNNVVIGITGSNGKTTTTTLITNLLSESKMSALSAGNIGNGFIEVVHNSQPSDIIVTELSSFQLQGTKKFRPNISVLLNIYEAHLDYHGTLEAYIEAKSKLIQNQTSEDYCVYNEDNVHTSNMTHKTNAKKYGFSTKNQNAYSFFDGFTFFVNNEAILTTNDILLKGIHNAENILASITVAKLMNVSNQSIISTLKSFVGVEHRLQYVNTVNERKFYNDSKSTNLIATKTAINAFTEPIILLMGGLDRGVDFLTFSDQFKQTKAIITFGQTNEKIYDAAIKCGHSNVHLCNVLEEAVKKSYALSNVGDVILLSPGCASWDAYKRFEDRGKDFVNLVELLKQKEYSRQ